MLCILLLILFNIVNTVAYRTSVCFHENEEFSLCGWRCPMTCVNIKLLNRGGGLCSSKWECHVGCRCSAGYVRDEVSKHCVLVQNCPVTRKPTMEFILLVCVAVAAASAAPVSESWYRDWQKELFDAMELNRHQEAYPTKRSNFGSLYVSPCSAAASAPMSAYAPAAAAALHKFPSAAAPYSYGHAYQVPAHPGYVASHYGHPYYRAEDEVENEHELMGLSDMNHVTFNHEPMARYSYGAAPSSQGGGAAGAGQVAASGPVVGVFTNANVGGCSVPLLVSCSPSIAQGRIVKSQAYYDSAGSSTQQSNVYRGVNEQHHHEDAEMHQEKTAQSPELLTHNSKPLSDEHQ